MSMKFWQRAKVKYFPVGCERATLQVWALWKKCRAVGRSSAQATSLLADDRARVHATDIARYVLYLAGTSWGRYALSNP